jgi:hypothetical protein
MPKFYGSVFLCREARIDPKRNVFDITEGGIAKLPSTRPEGSKFAFRLFYWFPLDATHVGEHELVLSAVLPDGGIERTHVIRFVARDANAVATDSIGFAGFVAPGEYEIRAAIDGEQVAALPLTILPPGARR